MLKRDGSQRGNGKLSQTQTYQLIMTVHYVDRLTAGGNIILMLEKTDQRQPVCTPGVPVNKTTRTAMFMDTVLKAELNFTQMGRTEGVMGATAFKPKLVKLSIRAADNKDGASISKTYFNAADYVDAKPPGKKVRVDLESGGSVIATLKCMPMDNGDAISTGISESPTSVTELAASGSGFMTKRLTKAIGPLVGKLNADSDAKGAAVETLQKENVRLRTLLEVTKKKAERAMKLRKENKRLNRELEGLEKSQGGDNTDYYNMVRMLCDVREQKAYSQMEREGLEFVLGRSTTAGDGGLKGSNNPAATKFRRP